MSGAGGRRRAPSSGAAGPSLATPERPDSCRPYGTPPPATSTPAPAATSVRGTTTRAAAPRSSRASTRPSPTRWSPHPHRHGGGRTGPLLPPMRQAVGAYDSAEPPQHGAYDMDHGDENADDEGRDRATAGERRPAGDGVRHAYYPDRRMNLGVVLLPLRVLLGFISIYAGMGKLCDPAYFEGGDRGSMVKWLSSLHPWSAAEPLRDFALSHPVGAGLSVAFLQVVVGVLTLLGLWQRVAAAFGALLSAAILVTVSWRSVATYGASDILFLAAWSPLVIAGAPVYSLDGRLAGEAWRTLGPRSEIGELRRRVLRRGSAVATVVVGLTLLVGSMLGGAVRSSEVVTVPGPDSYPTNQLPGSRSPARPRTRSASLPAPRRGVVRRPLPPALPVRRRRSSPPRAPTPRVSPARPPGASTGQPARRRAPARLLRRSRSPRSPRRATTVPVPPLPQLGRTHRRYGRRRFGRWLRRRYGRRRSRPEPDRRPASADPAPHAVRAATGHPVAALTPYGVRVFDTREGLRCPRRRQLLAASVRSLAVSMARQ